jgi:hypothetical protein
VPALAGALEEALEAGPSVTGRRERGLVLAGRHGWERSAEQHARIYAEVAAGKGRVRVRRRRGDTG